jgi:hypothetical protein
VTLEQRVRDAPRRHRVHVRRRRGQGRPGQPRLAIGRASGQDLGVTAIPLVLLTALFALVATTAPAVSLIPRRGHDLGLPACDDAAARMTGHRQPQPEH